MTERFVSSLSHLLKKGVSLSDAIDCSIFCIPEKIRLRVVERLAATGEGDEIAESFVVAFPLLSPYVGLISQSLSSGELANTLGMVSSRLTYEREVRAQMKSAFIYPAALSLIALFAVVSMLVFIVPQVQKTLVNTKIKIGGMSQVVFGVSNVLVKHPFFCLFILASILLVAAFYRRQLREIVRKQFFMTAALYRLMSDYELSLFWSYISLSYISSRDLETSFRDGAKSIENLRVREYFEQVGKGVVGGLVGCLGDIYVSQKLSRYIHKDIVDFWKATVAVELRSGSLDLVFLELANFHKERNEQKIKLISRLAEPFAMIVIGGVIGIISIAMLSPFYEMTQGISSL